jgi:hypothetical protein
VADILKFALTTTTTTTTAAAAAAVFFFRVSNSHPLLNVTHIPTVAQPETRDGKNSSEMDASKSL